MPTPDCPDDGALMGFLAEGDDPGGHIEGCQQCRGRVDILRGLLGTFRSLVPADRPAPPAVPGPAAPYHPAVLGKFFVLRVLRDREEEAVVAYRGVHRHVHQSEVVLYLARAALTKDEAGGEVAAAACKPLTRLNHPRIAKAIDVGVWEDRPFLAIEAARGVGLEDVLGSRTFSAAEAASIAAELARALASAHRDGLIHGAISASSIVLDADDRPTLIDFGIAHLTGHAPKDGDADARVRDLSALGTIIRLLSSGRPTSPSLEAARARAMAADPARRYADADQLALALERSARGRFPRAYLLIAVALVLVLAAGLWRAWRGSR